MFLVSLTFCFASPNVRADSGTMSFLRWNPDVYTSGLSAGTVTAGRTLASLTTNPALIGERYTWRVGGTFGQPVPLFRNIAHSFLGIRIPFSGPITLALSGQWYWLGRQAMTTEASPSIMMGFDTEAYLGRITGSYNLSPRWIVGLSITELWYTKDYLSYYLSESNWRKAHRANWFDVGSIWTSGPIRRKSTGSDWIDFLRSRRRMHRWKIGAALCNLGPKVTFLEAERSDHLPERGIIGGEVYWGQWHHLALRTAMDIQKDVFSPSVIDELRVGSEIRFMQFALFTIGYTLRRGEFTPNIGTLGLGVETRYGAIYFARRSGLLKPTYAWEGEFQWVF